MAIRAKNSRSNRGKSDKPSTGRTKAGAANAKSSKTGVKPVARAAKHTENSTVSSAEKAQSTQSATHISVAHGQETQRTEHASNAYNNVNTPSDLEPQSNLDTSAHASTHAGDKAAGVIRINAPVWKRIVSMIIDLAILDIVALMPLRRNVISMLPNGTDTGNFRQIIDVLNANPQIGNTLTSYSIVTGLLLLAYFVILESKLGQTPGKMIMKLYVVPESADAKVSFVSYIIRNIIAFPVFPFVILLIIDPLYMLFAKSHQRLTEKWSKTKVVEELSYKASDYYRLAEQN